MNETDMSIASIQSLATSLDEHCQRERDLKKNTCVSKPAQRSVVVLGHNTADSSRDPDSPLWPRERFSQREHR